MKKILVWAGGVTALYVLLYALLPVGWGFVSILSPMVSFATLVFFGFFLASIFDYKYGFIFSPMATLPALPVINFLYYKVYSGFMPHQLLQALMSEMQFVISTIKVQATSYLILTLVFLLFFG